jgi:hypothetical protein
MKSISEIYEQENRRYGSALMTKVLQTTISFEETRGKKD